MFSDLKSFEIDYSLLQTKWWHPPTHARGIHLLDSLDIFQIDENIEYFLDFNIVDKHDWKVDEWRFIVERYEKAIVCQDQYVFVLLARTTYKPNVGKCNQ